MHDFAGSSVLYNAVKTQAQSIPAQSLQDTLLSVGQLCTKKLTRHLSMPQAEKLKCCSQNRIRADVFYCKDPKLMRMMTHDLQGRLDSICATDYYDYLGLVYIV